MKVLMINGSPRKSGNTSIALAEIAGRLEKLGIESEIVWIGNKPVRGCMACNKCKDNPGACVFNDDICNEISAKMNGCDALIVGSPVYWGQPNGAVLSVAYPQAFDTDKRAQDRNAERLHRRNCARRFGAGLAV